MIGLNEKIPLNSHRKLGRSVSSIPSPIKSPTRRSVANWKKLDHSKDGNVEAHQPESNLGVSELDDLKPIKKIKNMKVFLGFITLPLKVTIFIVVFINDIFKIFLFIENIGLYFVIN